MKPITLIGIVLLVLGALALAYQGINYTRQEKVVDIGPLHATAEKHERIPLPLHSVCSPGHAGEEVREDHQSLFQQLAGQPRAA